MIVLTVTSGCSTLVSKDGPTGAEVRGNAEVRVEDAGRLSYAMVKLSPLVLTTIQTELKVPAVFTRLAASGPAANVRVGPSDTVGVTIFEAASGGLFIPREAGARPGNFIQVPTQEVDRNGNINIPYGGPVRALGRTPRQIEQEIEQRLSQRAVEPQAVVTIGERSSNAVSILGDVGTPKAVPLKPGGLRLLAGIADAGGPRYPAAETIVTLQRRGKVEQAVLSAILRDPRQNIQLGPEDVVYVSYQPKTFLAFGATPLLNSVVVGPGGSGTSRRFNFDAENLTLAEGLAKAGGVLSDRGDARAVFLFRFMPRPILEQAGVDVSRIPGPEVPTVITVDLSDAEGYLLANQFYMKDKDILFVADAPSTDLTKFFNVINAVTLAPRNVAGMITDFK